MIINPANVLLITNSVCFCSLSVMEITDNLLAQELERRERAALKLQEQREFERLQVCFPLFVFCLGFQILIIMYLL